MEKRFFLYQSESILFCYKPVVSHPTPTHHYKEPVSVFSVLLIGVEGCCEVPPHPSDLYAEQALLSQPLLTGQLLQHLTIMVALVNLLQFLTDFLVLGSQNRLIYLDVI